MVIALTLVLRGSGLTAVMLAVGAVESVEPAVIFTLSTPQYIS